MTLSDLSPRTRRAARRRPVPGHRPARPRADHGRHPRRRMLPGVGNRPGIHPRQGRVIPPGRRPVGDGLAAGQPQGRTRTGGRAMSWLDDMQATRPRLPADPGTGEPRGRLHDQPPTGPRSPPEPTLTQPPPARPPSSPTRPPPAPTACTPPRRNRPCTSCTCSAPAPTPNCRSKPNWRQAHDPRARPPQPAHRPEHAIWRSKPRGTTRYRTVLACSRSPPARGTRHSPTSGGSPAPGAHPARC